MSANNWMVCPFCQKTATNERNKAIAEAEASYGKVPAAEYTAALAKANNLPVDEEDETLREDWELGICEDGKFFVSYSGGCDVCGFDYHFKHEVSADHMAKEHARLSAKTA